MSALNITTERSSSQSNHSSKKLIQILEYLVLQNRPIRLIDISKELGMNPSTVLRFLNVLEDCGYVTHNTNAGKYLLTNRLATLASNLHPDETLLTIAEPYLLELNQIFSEMVSIAIEQDQQIVYLRSIRSPQVPLRMTSRIGSIAPMHCTGIGKLFLLNYTDLAIDNLIANRGLTRFTDNTLTTKEQLLHELAQVRADNYAFDREECEIGLSCIAFPIIDSAGMIHAGVSISAPTSHIQTIFSEHANIEKAQSIVRRFNRDLGLYL